MQVTLSENACWGCAVKLENSMDAFNLNGLLIFVVLKLFVICLQN